MSMSYIIHAGRRVVVMRGAGVLTAEEIYDAREKIRTDRTFDPSYAQLFDLRDVAQVDISLPAMARLAASAVFSPGVRRAFVCTDDIQYQMAETYSALSEPHEQVIHVFREMNVAEAWLLSGS